MVLGDSSRHGNWTRYATPPTGTNASKRCPSPPIRVGHMLIPHVRLLPHLHRRVRPWRDVCHAVRPPSHNLLRHAQFETMIVRPIRRRLPLLGRRSFSRFSTGRTIGPICDSGRGHQALDRWWRGGRPGRRSVRAGRGRESPRASSTMSSEQSPQAVSSRRIDATCGSRRPRSWRYTARRWTPTFTARAYRVRTTGPGPAGGSGSRVRDASSIESDQHYTAQSLPTEQRFGLRASVRPTTRPVPRHGPCSGSLVLATAASVCRRFTHGTLASTASLSPPSPADGAARAAAV
jgi:hypothetical protein